ncbi:MAG: NTP transferase domain-containing protein [Acetobacter aceti]|uniref:Molybdenum cofactor guanylyltransferase n=1 Tax=Acetobacter aceti TaxID=435 RepID=A0A1U9KGQ9_ACEAC|nr:NTP transferase domain-containing protein [Acetobacter aceti]AQS84992.1 molybdenum cofactor guanylyltransferase [Acetobacter aceti]
MKPLYGLVLAGGVSSRMGQDKAALVYEGRPQLDRAFSLLAPRVSRCFVSLRKDQKTDVVRSIYPGIADRSQAIGPAAGLLAAHEEYPDVAWLALACDLPFLDDATLDALIAARREGCTAVAFRSEHDGLPEPFCTIWEPEALEMLSRQVASGRVAPRQALINGVMALLPACTPGALDNINTPEERRQAELRLAGGQDQTCQE